MAYSPYGYVYGGAPANVGRSIFQQSLPKRNEAVQQIYPHAPGQNPVGASIYANAVRNMYPQQSRPPSVPNLPGPPSTPGVPPAAPPPSTGGNGAGGSTTYDYSSDPMLQMALGQFGRDESGLKGDLLEKQRRFLLGFGSRELAQKVLGQNDPALQTIEGNPFSTLANLTSQFGKQRFATNEDLNQQNLFFSSWRNRQLADLGNQELGAKAEATSGAESTLSSLRDAFLAAMRNVNQSRLDAEAAAYQRAIQAAMSGAYGATSSIGEPTSDTPSNVPPMEMDPLTALMIAARRRQAVPV